MRVLSYQVAAALRARRLRVVLAAHEPSPLPVQLVQLPGVPARGALAFAALAAARLPERLRQLVP